MLINLSTYHKIQFSYNHVDKKNLTRFDIIFSIVSFVISVPCRWLEIFLMICQAISDSLVLKTHLLCSFKELKHIIIIRLK